MVALGSTRQDIVGLAWKQAAEYELPAQLLGACSIALEATLLRLDLHLCQPETSPIQSLSPHCQTASEQLRVECHLADSVQWL